MIMAEKEKYYTVEEVARELRVSIETVRRLIADGLLQTFRVGRQHRITQEQLDEYLRRK